MAEYSDSPIAMTAAEETAFLDSFKTARIATISPDGYPHNVPVGYDHRDGRIYVPSDEQSQKIANIERNAKICFIVDEGVAGRDVESMKGIMIQGDAGIFGEDEHPEVKHDSLVDGMMETEEIAESARDHYERVDRVVVEIVPHNIVSWDFTKVHGD